MTKLYQELKYKNKEDALHILTHVSPEDLKREYFELVEFKVQIENINLSSPTATPMTMSTAEKEDLMNRCARIRIAGATEKEPVATPLPDLKGSKLAKKVKKKKGSKK